MVKEKSYHMSCNHSNAVIATLDGVVAPHGECGGRWFGWSRDCRRQNHVVVAIATITIVAATVASDATSIVIVATSVVALMTISTAATWCTGGGLGPRMTFVDMASGGIRCRGGHGGRRRPDHCWGMKKLGTQRLMGSIISALGEGHVDLIGREDKDLRRQCGPDQQRWGHHGTTVPQRAQKPGDGSDTKPYPHLQMNGWWDRRAHDVL
jgi:hypothetical protein